MARPFAKSLEEQLASAQEELKKAEEKVVTTKQKIADLNYAIRERDKENVFLMLEKQGLSVEDVQALLASRASNETTENKTIKIKTQKRA